MSKTTKHHKPKGEKKQETKHQEDAELNQRVEGGEGTGQTKAYDEEKDQQLADEALNEPLKPTKAPTGPKPGEIEQ